MRSCYLFDSITIGSDILAIGANTYLDESLDKFTISVEIYSEKKLKFWDGNKSNLRKTFFIVFPFS